MVKYLQMDGVDDYLDTPSIMFDKIEIDGLFNKRTTEQFLVHIKLGGSGYVRVGGNGTTLQLNNFTGSGYVQGTRTLLTITRLTGVASESSLKFFAENILKSYALVSVYNIKLFNGSTIQAHYDMSTGTVQDQSGNGNHATLTGGTWLDDGTGGGETGTEVISSYASKQSIYAPKEITGQTKQVIHTTQFKEFMSNLVLYKAITSDYRTKQMISRNTDTTYSTSQVISLVGGREISTFFPTKQQISLVRRNDFATQQTIKGRFYKTLNLHTSSRTEVKLNVVLSDVIIEVVSYIGQAFYQPNPLRTVSEMEVMV